MDVYQRSFVKNEKYTFTEHIENFYVHIRHGIYTSPTYYSMASECKWILIMKVYDDEIIISLRRKDYKRMYQYVEVYLNIDDSFGLSSLYASKGIHFTPEVDEDAVLRVSTKELIFDYYGLNKVRFVSNDNLTVKCEITTYTTSSEIYGSKEDFKKYVKISNYLLTRKNLKFMFLSFFIALFYVYIIWDIANNYTSKVMLFIGREFRPLSDSEFKFAANCVTIILFLIWLHVFVPIEGAILIALWKRINPGGDRTCYKSPYNCREAREELYNNIVYYRGGERSRFIEDSNSRSNKLKYS